LRRSRLVAARAGAEGVGRGGDDKIIARDKRSLVQPVNFTQLTAQAVALHGMGQLCADGQTDAVRLRAVFPAVEHEIAVGRTLPFAVEAAEDMIELQRGRKLHKRPPSGNCADFVT